jgi:hypothetical protein
MSKVLSTNHPLRISSRLAAVSLLWCALALPAVGADDEPVSQSIKLVANTTAQNQPEIAPAIPSLNSPIGSKWQTEELPLNGQGTPEAGTTEEIVVDEEPAPRWLPELQLPSFPSNGRSRGIGTPLERDSWMNRPYSFSAFTGAFAMGNPIAGRVDGTTGYFTGFRAGWDTSYFWGLETRFGFSTVGLSDPNQLQTLGTLKAFLLDTNLLYYPLGDTQWRPYASLGFGLADYNFNDDTGHNDHNTAFNMPFGIGVKYRHNARWVFRLDALDNLSFATGNSIGTMNNFSITAGIEARLGFGPRASYWPWNPTRSFR